MSVLRFRLIGSRADVDDVIARIHGIDNIERVEELGVQGPTVRDDSSSSESVSDNAGHTYVVEVEAPDAATADRARVVAEACTFARNAGIEFINAV